MVTFGIPFALERYSPSDHTECPPALFFMPSTPTNSSSGTNRRSTPSWDNSLPDADGTTDGADERTGHKKALDALSRKLSTYDLADDASAESERLEALNRYEILDTASEQAFDHITEMASYLFEAPIAAVSLIDRDRQWLKSCVGLQAEELELESSICARAIQSPGVLVIEDTTADPEYACMDVVKGEPHIRFYAGAPLETADGHYLGTLCVLDTTPRNEPDKEKIQHLEHLASIVVDEMELRLETRRRNRQAQSLRQTAQRAEIARATAETARQRAEEARRRAEEASASKSRFLTGMAHDLRSPISAIDGFAQLLKRTVSAASKKHAERILQATAHLRDMANTLSELAELESGSINLTVTPCDVCSIVKETAAALTGRAEAADIDLSVSTPDADVVAIAHEQSLRRVIDNLAGNAIKYCEGGDEVIIRLHAPGRGDPSIRVEISDTGPGIDSEFLDIMYEPFTQKNESADGSGLGLAVTKELVQAMNGRIETTSSPEDGTTFRVHLPRISNGASSMPLGRERGAALQDCENDG